MSNLESAEADFDQQSNILPAAYKRQTYLYAYKQLSSRRTRRSFGRFREIWIIVWRTSRSHAWRSLFIETQAICRTCKCKTFPVPHRHFKLSKDEVNAANLIHDPQKGQHHSFCVRLYRSQPTCCETSFASAKRRFVQWKSLPIVQLWIWT